MSWYHHVHRLYVSGLCQYHESAMRIVFYDTFLSALAIIGSATCILHFLQVMLTLAGARKVSENARKTLVFIQGPLIRIYICCVFCSMLSLFV